VGLGGLEWIRVDGLVVAILVGMVRSIIFTGNLGSGLLSGFLRML